MAPISFFLCNNIWDRPAGYEFQNLYSACNFCYCSSRVRGPLSPSRGRSRVGVDRAAAAAAVAGWSSTKNALPLPLLLCRAASVPPAIPSSSGSCSRLPPSSSLVSLGLAAARDNDVPLRGEGAAKLRRRGGGEAEEPETAPDGRLDPAVASPPIKLLGSATLLPLVPDADAAAAAAV